MGDSIALSSSLSFTLPLREVNISGYTITKFCGFAENTQLFGLENDCIGARTIAMKELLNQNFDNGSVILMYNHIAKLKRSFYNSNFIVNNIIGLRALLALGYRVVLVYPFTIPTDYDIAITKNIYAKTNSKL